MSRPLFFVCLAFVALTVTTVRAGSVDDLDRANGLPDAQLGAPLASFQGLQKTEDSGRWLSFKRPTDKLRYGKYELTNITYNFFKDRLYSINLDVVGKGNVRGILKLLEQSYGKDHTKDTLPLAKTTQTLDVREWSGKRVYCVMKNGSEDDGGVLTLLDKPTWDALQLPKKERLEASKRMLGSSVMDDGLTAKPAGNAAPPNSAAAPDQPAAAPNPAQAAPNPPALFAPAPAQLAPGQVAPSPTP